MSVENYTKHHFKHHLKTNIIIISCFHINHYIAASDHTGNCSCDYMVNVHLHCIMFVIVKYYLCVSNLCAWGRFIINGYIQ